MMKELINDIKGNRDVLGSLGNDLQELGFKKIGKLTSASQYYLKLDHNKISDFLIEQHIKKWGVNPNGRFDPFRVYTFKDKFFGGDYLGITKWVETPIKDYEGIPPPHVLEALKLARERNLFSSFEIAELHFQEKAPDPLLLGFVEKERFIIAQWDDDIVVDDLI